MRREPKHGQDNRIKRVNLAMSELPSPSGRLEAQESESVEVGVARKG